MEKLFYDENEKSEFKLYHKVRDHCHYAGKYRGAAHSICNLKYKVPKEISVVIHNAGFDTHFIIKQLAEEFDSQFECIGENTEKYSTFSVLTKKEHDNCNTSTYKLKFIDSFRVMPTHYQILLIIYLKVTKNNAKHAWKEKLLNKNVILLSLKTINYVKNVKNLKKYG